ncbi:MAG: hypothetical protein ACE5NM_04840 [Sedimentisphaerales bacterium]
MLSRILLSVAAILFASVPAFAQPPIGAAAGSIYQYQNFVVGDIIHNDGAGLSSILIVSHGEDAFALNSLEIENEQSVPAWFSISPLWIGDSPWQDGPKTKANQWQSADIKQKTEADSDCGIITVSAFLSAGGEQEQFIGYSNDLKAQGQTLGLVADQVLLATGNADGTAINDADDVQQGQYGKNGAGSMSEYSYIDAFQMAEVDGKSNTTVTAMNSMVVSTDQNQAVIGPLSGLPDLDP